MLISSFDGLFDKTSPGLKLLKGKSIVKENSPGATVKSLQLFSKGKDFFCYPSSLVESMPDLTTRRTSKIKDSNCDGILIVADSKSTEQLVLVELKSTFDIERIAGAYNQVLHSFLKLHSLFSQCEDYSLDQLPVLFIVGCKCFKDKIQESAVYDKISIAKMLNQDKFEAKFLGKLLVKQSVTVYLNEFNDIKRNPFHKDIKGKSIMLSLRMTNKFSDKSISVRL